MIDMEGQVADGFDRPLRRSETNAEIVDLYDALGRERFNTDIHSDTLFAHIAAFQTGNRLTNGLPASRSPNGSVRQANRAFIPARLGAKWRFLRYAAPGCGGCSIHGRNRL